MFLRITSTQFADLIRTLGRADNFSYANTKALYDYLEERHDGGYEFDMIEIAMSFHELSLDDVNREFDLDLDHDDDDPQEIQERIERAGGDVVNIDASDEDNYRVLIAE